MTPGNDVRGTSTEIPYCWRATTSISVVLLISRRQYLLGALTTDQRKVSHGAKPFTDFSVTSGEFESTCKEKQWNKYSLWCDKKYEWEIVTWVQIIESWSDWGSAKRLTPYFPCADVGGTWNFSMDPIYVSEAKREAKKIDPKLFMIPSNQLNRILEM